MISIASYLALKEIFRNRGRFFLVSLVIALITLLVLFIAGVGEGLGNGNREFVSKLEAQLLVFQEKTDYVIGGSRLPSNVVNQVRRVNGVADAGVVATANTAILLPNNKVLKVALLGVTPGHTGEPRVVEGRQLSTDLAREVLIDRNVALRTKLKVGDRITIRSTQGTKDEFYTLDIVGLTEGQSFFLQPAIITPFYSWDRVRPKSDSEVNNSSYVMNVVAVRLNDPAQQAEVKQRLLAEVPNVDVADIPTAINNLPGYTAQQSTLQTQAVFTLLIGVLVIGGFFQIQILQKVPQIGVLKAIGATNSAVGLAAVLQIIIITIVGVGIGSGLTFLLALGLPASVPIIFNGTQTVIAIAALVVIGPLGGIVSVRYAVQIEPLKALRLS